MRRKVTVIERSSMEERVGYLLGFGTDYINTNQGLAQYTMAIVEMEGGQIETFPLSAIRFTEDVCPEHQ